jgi:hypothetical protein
LTGCETGTLEELAGFSSGRDFHILGLQGIVLC